MVYSIWLLAAILFLILALLQGPITFLAGYPEDANSAYNFALSLACYAVYRNEESK